MHDIWNLNIVPQQQSFFARAVLLIRRDMADRQPLVGYMRMENINAMWQ